MSNAIKIGDIYVKASAIIAFTPYKDFSKPGRKHNRIFYPLAANPQIHQSPYMTKKEADKISKEILDAWEGEGK